LSSRRGEIKKDVGNIILSLRRGEEKERKARAIVAPLRVQGEEKERRTKATTT
jgi:hypothetical protein